MAISRLFHSLSIDFIGPVPTTKTHKKYLIVAVEHVSGWPVASASASAGSSVVVAFIHQEILNTFGLPRIVMGDNGTHFAAAFVNDFEVA